MNAIPGEPRMRNLTQKSSMHGGFTLIELLIVVAIIGILAGIAVPNFLEAQTRAKVARVHADMRTVRNALSSYRLDRNSYFIGFLGSVSHALNKWELTPLTSPVAYISSIPQDVFRKGQEHYVDFAPYDYYSMRLSFVARGVSANVVDAELSEMPDYTLSSDGPDRDYDYSSMRSFLHYNPSNGTTSDGDIWTIVYGTLD